MHWTPLAIIATLTPTEIRMNTEPRPSAPANPTRADYPHFLAIPTRWMDNDVYGHVNNVV